MSWLTRNETYAYDFTISDPRWEILYRLLLIYHRYACQKRMKCLRKTIWYQCQDGEQQKASLLLLLFKSHATDYMAFFLGTGDNTVLRKVDVPIISNSHCRRLLAGIYSKMVCAGYLQGGKDACQVLQSFPMHSSNWITLYLNDFFRVTVVDLCIERRMAINLYKSV